MGVFAEVYRQDGGVLNLSKSLRPSTTVLTLLLSWCCIAMAQQDGDSAARTGEKTAKPQAAAKVEESHPSVYYLPDKQGNLQPVLDFQYQDFLELYKLKNQLQQRNEPPRYSIQRLTITGMAGKENVELDVRFQILVRNDNWVRIPLRLDQGVLRGAVKYQGPGEQFVHYETDSDGYVCWVRGKSDSQHEITLRMLVPLAGKGDQPRLKLCVPRAAASELKLTVPVSDAIGTVSEGATLLSSTGVEGGATELNVVGLGSEFELSWRKTDPRVVETPPALEAIGTVLSKLDGHLILSEATLSVRSYGAAFHRFIVQLPPGAELTPKSTDAYDVAPLETVETDKTLQRRVEVRLPKKTVGPVEVRLTCRRDYDPLKDKAWCELAGFEVQGAIRQWGTHSVTVPDDWQVSWGAQGADRNLKETDIVPDTVKKEDILANFEYSAQPYSLTARLSPRKTQIHVDPKYQLWIDPDKVRLEGTLSYTIRGSKTSTLEVAIPGWELDDVGPDSRIATDGATSVNDNVVIPLAKPTSGTIELVLRAHRAIDAKNAAFRVELPRPQSHYTAPASVSVSPADNVELIPDSQNIEGLARQWKNLPQAFEIFAERPQEALYYRGTGGKAVFAGAFRVHAGQISVDAFTQVAIRERTAEVEQRQSYTIAYEPVDRLTVSVPRVLTRAKRLEAFCDGKPLTLIALENTPAGKDTARPVLMRAVLPSPRIGSCDLMLRYSMPLVEPTPEKPSSLSLPLPMPEVGHLTANHLKVKAAENICVLHETKDGWTVVEDKASASGSGNNLRLNAEKAVSQLDLNLRWNDDAVGSTVVSRAWVQSWFSSTLRQDRAAYQVITDRQELEVLFPAGTALNQTVVFVDGKQVESRTVGEDRLLIPLPIAHERRRVVLELLYHETDPRPPRGALHLEFPRIGPGAWVRRLYWQLVLPSDEHVIAHPDGFTGEFVWGWRNYFWEEQPLLDQEQLEEWIGVAPRAPLPERANHYLYSALGDPQQADLHTAGRTWIVLLASGAALVAGLLLIYVPACRHPVVLLVLGIALTAAGLIAPEPTFLLVQAASLGLVLSFLAGLLERGMTRQQRRAAIRKEPSNARVELGSTHTRIRTSSALGPASTETLPTIQASSLGNADP
jgi:hypothetical protein